MVVAIDIRLLGKKRTGDEAVFFHLTKELLQLDTPDISYELLTDETDATKIATLYARLRCIGKSTVTIVSLPTKNRFTWNAIALPKYLAHHRVDILHTQYILPFFVPKRTKIVTHIHDISFRVYPELIGLSDRFFLSILIPQSLRRATRILTPSQFTKNEIIQYYGIDEEKITVIPNGIGEEFLHDFSNELEKGKEIQKKYHLPDAFILSVGTLQPRKNIPFLITAFSKLKKRLPNIKLVIVGKRDAHHVDMNIDKVIKERQLEDDVVFPGFIETNDLPSLINLSKVFVFPSLYEGFGIPLLEAMSQNVPVASSDIPSLREVGGDAVTYFNPRNVASCEEVLYTLCTDNQVRLRLEKAGKDTIKRFSWKESALLLVRLYQSIK